MSARSCDQLYPITADHISATCQSPSVPISATYQCIPVHINATYQCPSELPFSAAYQCQSVPPVSADYQCHISVLPFSAHQ
ncbi:unnamed protein product [Staurois parvus]|uniref:Uncharacterized protein n=1 Tax=Staurois parvus TaxID=386267 RepID=A0ABN9H8J1_9NEOB|nr:unnamed protein product [Staurois parvus]